MEELTSSCCPFFWSVAIREVIRQVKTGKRNPNIERVAQNLFMNNPFVFIVMYKQKKIGAKLHTMRIPSFFFLMPLKLQDEDLSGRRPKISQCRV